MKSRLTLLLGVAVIVLAGCGPPASSPPPPPSQSSQPAPTASAIAPASVLVASAPGTVIITGTNFDPKATVTFAGAPASSVSVVSATQITFATTATELTKAAVDAVVITNPDGQTTSINFTVDNPTPTVTAVQPQPVFPCDAPATLTVTGTNFLTGTTVNYNGESKTPTLTSATQLTIPLTLADVAKPGSYPVAVTLAGPGGGTATQNFVVSTPTGATLSGQGSANALLTVSTLQTGAGSVSGTAICTAQTDATGFFKVTLDAPTAASLDVSTAAGGTINFLGSTMQTLAAPTFDALLDSAPGNSTVSGLSLSMFSEFAYHLAVSDYIHGKDATLIAAHADATKLLNGFYHFSGATAIELIPPQGSDAALEMEAEQGVLNEGVQSGWKNPADLIAALALDLGDGVWNGRVSYSGEPALLATAGTSDYLDAAINWANSSAGQAALPNPPSAELVQGAAACTCTPEAIGLNQTSAGNIAYMAFAGHEYIFQVFGSSGLSGKTGIAVYDVTDPTAPVAPKMWTSGLGAYWGVAAVLGATDHPQIFVFDGGDTGVAVLNARTLATGNPATDNPVEFSGNLSFTASAPATVSPGQLWISSAVWDGCALGCHVLLASADGYTFFDPQSDQLDESQDYAVAGGQNLSESLGTSLVSGIPVLGAAAAPPVAVAGNGYGIQLVDFGAKASYYLPFSSLQAALPGFPIEPFDESIDQTAVDSVYDVAVLTHEAGSNSTIGFVNLNGITETAGSPNRFAPGTPAAEQATIATGASLSLEAAAVDSVSHTLVAGGASFLAGTIASPASWGASVPGISDWVFYNVTSSPSLASPAFAESTDSNGLVAFPGLGMGASTTLGISYGYIGGAQGSNAALLQIDLTGLLAMPRQGASGDAAHQPQGDPATTKDTTTGGLILQAIVF